MVRLNEAVRPCLRAGVATSNGKTTRQKVVHLLTRYQRGGAERRLVDLIAALPKDAFSHTVVVGPDSDLQSLRAALPQARVLVEPRLRRTINPIRDVAALLGLVTLLRREQPLIVHTCHSKAGILGRLAARAAGTPSVVHTLSMRNFGPTFGSLTSVVYRFAERWVGRWTDAYLVVGDDLLQWYRTWGIGDPGRFHVIRSPLDV